MEGDFDLRTVLKAVADALDVPRNRFGKLTVTTSEHAMKQHGIQNLAIQLHVGGCEDVVEQAVKVIRATLAQGQGVQ